MRDLVITRKRFGFGLNLEKRRSDPQISFNDWLELLGSFGFGGTQYTLPQATQEEIDGFTSYARAAYKANGIVFACMAVRRELFSQPRFVFRRVQRGRVGDIFGDPSLGILEKPWPGGTTADLLARVITYVDLAGNAFVLRQRDRLMVLRPDWVTIVAGSPRESQAGDEPSVWDPEAELLGYLYQPGGPGSGRDPIRYFPEEVAHFAPIPDPEARYRGMSWLTPIVREVMSDKAATEHKLMFFENAATPQLAVKLDVADLEKFSKWIEKFSEQHEGAHNAYKTLYLGAGADVTVVGKDLQQIDFKATQGAGETRIAAAAGVPPVIVGLSEGLQGSSLNEGNYAMARRRLADVTLWSLWQNLCGTLEVIVPPPPANERTPAQLWIDSSGIPFLREDAKDEADIFAVEAQAYRQLVDGGVEPTSAAAAVAAKDITLVKHSGLLSVQLQEPGSGQEPSLNGKGDPANVPVPA